jgi:DNA modification methylase
LSKYKLHIGNALTILKELPDPSVNCWITSPPYWGLRDYGVEGQLGLEKTPEEYVSKMVNIFREARRVLRDDGTLWLNLGTSYANSNGGRSWEFNASKGYADNLGKIGIIKHGDACGSNSNRSPLLQRVPSCGNDGKEFPGFQGVDRVCRDSCDAPQAETQTHRVGNVRNDQSFSQDEQRTLPRGHDTGHSDYAQEPPRSLPPDAQESTIERSSCQHEDAFSREGMASVFQTKDQTLPDCDQGSVDKSACISGISQMLPTLVVRTVGKESFFSACGRSDCMGIGRCGLCWVNLTIPTLNVKTKDELNIPHLVAMALQSDGWYLRQTIIWHKPNPMPESVKDRCTKAHEYLFLLSKSERYYFDQDAIKEPVTGNAHPRGNGVNPKAALCGDHPRNVDCKYQAPGQPQHKGLRKKGLAAKTPNVWDTSTGSGGHGTIHRDGRQKGTKWRVKQNESFSSAVKDIVEERNKRSVWTIPTYPFSQAHFATFPPALVEPCVLAGCPEGGTVGDMFTGSGTTGEVSLKHFRRFVGIELNPTYANEIAIPRIEAEAVRHKQLSII